MRRRLIAFILCPLVIPLEVFILSATQCLFTDLSYGCATRVGVGTLVYGAFAVPLGWLGIVILAGPLYFLLAKFQRVSLFSLCLVGAFVGAAVTLPGALKTLDVNPMAWYFVLYGLIFGISSAVVFWWVGIREPRSDI